MDGTHHIVNDEVAFAAIFTAEADGWPLPISAERSVTQSMLRRVLKVSAWVLASAMLLTGVPGDGVTPARAQGGRAAPVLPKQALKSLKTRCAWVVTG